MRVDRRDTAVEWALECGVWLDFKLLPRDVHMDALRVANHS